MKKTIILANGPQLSSTWPKWVNKEDTLVCVDGGTLQAIQKSLIPDAIVGDMDSLPPDTLEQIKSQGVQLVRYPVRKNQTDLELALLWAREHNAREIWVVNALGGRLDQHLVNVFLLAREDMNFARIVLKEDDQSAVILRGPDRIILEGQPGDRLSLVVLSQTISGVTLDGVEWKTNLATFSRASTHPLSNIFTETQARIQIDTGIAFLVHIQDPHL
jgi:thiamine pyrophosphokinase